MSSLLHYFQSRTLGIPLTAHHCHCTVYVCVNISRATGIPNTEDLIEIFIAAFKAGASNLHNTLLTPNSNVIL